MDTRKKPDARERVVPAGRVRRLSRLSTMAAGVAGNMALNGVGQLGLGKRPTMRDLLLTPRNMHRVANELAHMRGAAMKVGQLLSMDTGDVLPPEISDIFARLRSDAYIMPPAQLKQVLTTGWPKHWLRAFHSFDVHPIAAASIGQVHRARLHDGRDMAIKVQYPSVAQSIDSDVSNVGALMRMSGLLPPGFDIAPYLEEARLQLHEETDYVREGEYLCKFAQLLRDDDRFMLPQLHRDWTRPSVLAMSFVDGIAIEDTLDKPQAERDRIARDMIDLMLRELFSFEMMQTDPNFANYRYDPVSGRIILLDFGASRQLNPTVARQYRDVCVAGLAGDDERLSEVAGEIGFLPPAGQPEHRDRILRMMKVVFASMREQPIYDFNATDLPQRLQGEGMILAQSGYVPPPLPVDVLYLQRKFGGVFLLAGRLRARVPLRDMLENALR